MGADIFNNKNNSQKLLNLLARTSEEIGGSLEYSETISSVCVVPVPLLADWSSLFIMEEKLAALSFTHCYHRDQKQNEKLKEYFRSDADSHIKRPVILDTLRKGRAVTEIREVPSPIAGFLLNLPLIQKADVVGFLTLGSRNNFSEDDIMMAEEFARRATCALDNSRRYQKVCLAEAELIKSKEFADIANKTKSEFLASMSHEIRSPVSAILGFTDLLMLPNRTEVERLEWGRRVKHNGHHLLRLINDILSLTKIESGQLSIENNNINFNQFFDDLKQALISQTRTKKIKLDFVLESAVPAEFTTDETRLQQILTNVIGNAIKFTDVGAVTIGAMFQKNSGLLCFNIEDTGPGLTEKQAAQLFHPFVQADAEHSKRCGGTGLGLAISKNLARLLGGDLELIHSEPGQGSKFRICIKPSVATGVKFISEYNIPDLSEESISSQKETLLQIVGKKILVVDDSLDNQYLMKTFLVDKGAVAVAVGSGQEALYQAEQNNFDIILMDIQMPVKDGYETAKELRLKGFQKPIVALTANVLSEDKMKSLHAGFDRHLTKPFDEDEFVRVLSELLIDSDK